MSDAEEDMEEVEEDDEDDDDEEEGEEETEEGESKKMLKRGISPIEWDVNSDELSEEEVEEEEEGESPREEKSENGSEKSEEEESKRTYPDGKINYDKSRFISLTSIVYIKLMFCWVGSTCMFHFMLVIQYGYHHMTEFTIGPRGEIF